MKIAYSLKIFPMMYQTFILNDMVHLMRKGNEVFIFSALKPYEDVTHKGVLSLKDNVYYYDDIILNNIGALKRFLMKVLCKTKKYNPYFSLIIKTLLNGKNSNNVNKYHNTIGWRMYGLAHIAKIMKEKRIDIIHAGFGTSDSTTALILSELTGIPFTFETHARDLFVDFPHSAEKIKRAEKIFTISNYNKSYLVKHLKCPAPKVIVKRVSCNKSYCDQISEKQKKGNLILSVCRLGPIKGLEFAIEAFKQVSQENNNLKYIIIGDGPLKNQLIKKVEELSLVNKITFLGDTTNEVALDYVAQSTLFLLPSVIAPDGDRDGIPTVLIEAMYLKTPVISSKISGIPELIDDGVSGFLTEPGNVNQVAEKMNKLLSDKSLRIRIGEEARKKVDNEFDIEDNTNKMINAWQEILQI